LDGNEKVAKSDFTKNLSGKKYSCIVITVRKKEDSRIRERMEDL